jgi:hypothetical protein
LKNATASFFGRSKDWSVEEREAGHDKSQDLVFKFTVRSSPFTRKGGQSNTSGMGEKVVPDSPWRVPAEERFDIAAQQG